MNTWSVLYHLMRADFLERVRRRSFLLTLGLTIFIGYLGVPPHDAKYVTLSLGLYRGTYNSAWTGSMLALLTATLMSLPGFYLVKNAIERDRLTGVGQIISTTPLSKRSYVLGKWLSNFAVLAVMVGVLTVVAFLMQLLRGEELHIRLWALVAPFLWLALPVMAVVAATAFLFETISWLRGGFGNVVYFFLWTMLLLTLTEAAQPVSTHSYVPTKDLFGVGPVLSSVVEACQDEYPDYEFTGGFDIGISLINGTPRTFRWEGVHWSLEIILGRLLWFGVALGICFVALPFFHGFDPARERQRRVRDPEAISAAPPEQETAPDVPLISLTPLPSMTRRFPFAATLTAELRLMVKGLQPWWIVVALGLIAVGLLIPVGAARRWALPFAWFWPVLIWSQMGVRELRHHTDGLIFSAPRVLWRQLPATWLAGVILAAFSGSGVAIRLFSMGDWGGLCAWTVGALFIPTLALAMGVWTGSSKPFEVVYTLLWYLGPINQATAFDFMGSSRAAVASGMPAIYLILTIALLASAFKGRGLQLQRD